MSPEAAPVESPASLGQLARLTGVFFEPGRTFADIGQRPGWILPFALLLVCSLCFTVLVGQRIGWDRIVRESIESNPRMQNLSLEQRTAAVATAVAMAAVGAYVGVLVGAPVGFLLMALVLWGMANLVGARLRFPQMWAIVCYGMLPSLLSTLAAVAVMFLKNPEDFNIRNPVGFNPGAYMDPLTTPKFLHSVMTSLDLFGIWILVLLAVGISAAGRKTSFGKALCAVALPWIVLVLGKAALSGLF
jgi:hypothetical protein